MATARRADPATAPPDTPRAPFTPAEVIGQLATARWVALTLLVLLASVLFAVASNWQYHRAIAAVDARRAEAAQPVPIADLVPVDVSEVPNAALGRPAVVVGQYQEQAWVAGRAAPDGRPGYWLVSGMDDGSDVLTAVLRGWLPAKEAPAGTADVEVTGRVHSDENFYVGVPGQAPDEAVAITNGNLEAIWDRPVRPGYLVLSEQVPPLTGADPLPVPPVFGAGGDGGFPWQNAGYAVQWLTFIAFAGFMYWRWFRDDLERAREDRQARAASLSFGGSDVR
jgi:cytochrome oxidase assembly protein ShyY1